MFFLPLSHSFPLFPFAPFHVYNPMQDLRNLIYISFLPRNPLNTSINTHAKGEKTHTQKSTRNTQLKPLPSLHLSQPLFPSIENLNNPPHKENTRATFLSKFSSPFFFHLFHFHHLTKVYTSQKFWSSLLHPHCHYYNYSSTLPQKHITTHHVQQPPTAIIKFIKKDIGIGLLTRLMDTCSVSSFHSIIHSFWSSNQFRFQQANNYKRKRAIQALPFDQIGSARRKDRTNAAKQNNRRSLQIN